MKVTLIALAGAALLATGAAHAQDLNALLTKNGCSACHAIDKKVVGPSYQEVATKYKGDAKAPAALFEKVKKGGSGVWGQVPMPPNPQVPDADLKKIIADILALKK
jgi:cytochrome c